MSCIWEGTTSLWATGRTAERQRTEVRRRVGATYNQARARRIAEESIRKEAAAKNRPADLLNIALEKVAEARLEPSAFSTFDAMAPKIRSEVNTSIWWLDPRPDGRPAPDGRLVESLEDKHELIAAGRAVAIGTPLDYATGLHPSLTTIPLDGVEPSQVVLATRTGDRSRLVTAFRKHAEALLSGIHQAGPIRTT
ncbi:hypothetical protein [Streptomyces scopuliridis]|uniref:hypothetical protein n=1 Tax=Streptomyces scopuliridis TaxID=452529 RepID=UPI00068FC12B